MKKKIKTSSEITDYSLKSLHKRATAIYCSSSKEWKAVLKILNPLYLGEDDYMDGDNCCIYTDDGAQSDLKYAEKNYIIIAAADFIYANTEHPKSVVNNEYSLY